jgi:translation initiation factor 3 subunit A
MDDDLKWMDGKLNKFFYYIELQVVGQDEAALQALHEVVLSKRSRSNPITVMEPIMLKYVELCVELKKGKMVKEGLHQYRNIAQNTSVNSIEVIN